ncbi:unnamed protein product [Bursaphelenchus okinawaensis]|uniref:AMP-binding domain-containing protein n=1 Tax=Bursaphelenchus okinawaensis TaxID=465554 RepID=A0A811LPJ2_9BILA|nr:unnamed protein product [Bursaphelenchus okinawaensis]CAG9125005.1 unnamed protein product [Bursaphelenchus okinawaensis]
MDNFSDQTLKKEIKKEIEEFYEENERMRNMVLYHRQILNAAEGFGEDIAMTDAETGETLSFKELRRRVFILAKELHEVYNVDKGDIVIGFTPNSIHYPIFFLAAALLGASLTGVNPEFNSDELGFYTRKTKCKCVFTTAELLERVVQATASAPLPIFVIGKLAGQLGIDLERLLQSAPVCEDMENDKGLNVDHVLLTPLSSGTTGTPKCVMLTHRNFIVQTEILKEAVFDKLTETGGRRSTIGVLPFYHASGFWALCYCLLAGHHTVVMQKFQAPLLLSCIEDYKVDSLNLIPSIITFLMKNDALVKEFDLSSVRTVLCGSAPLSPGMTQDFMERFPHVVNFVHGYGMTEIVALSHLSPLDLPLSDLKHMTSCGKLLPRFESKVVDIETGEEIVEPHKRGELYLRSECVMKGYLNDPKATEETIDSEKWMHTGDIVYFDSEGFYFIVDRIKNLIKVNGMQLSPLELESLLLSNDIVAEAAVIGVPADSFGEVPRAFVVLNYVPDDVQELTDKLRESVNAQVASYKHLRGGLVILPSLPRTASGKVQKEELRRFSLTSPLLLPQITETLVDLKLSEQEKTPTTDEAKEIVKTNELVDDEDETFL